MYKVCQNIQPCNKIYDYRGHFYIYIYIYIYDDGVDKNTLFSNALNSLHSKHLDVTDKFYVFRIF